MTLFDSKVDVGKDNSVDITVSSMGIADSEGITAGGFNGSGGHC